MDYSWDLNTELVWYLNGGKESSLHRNVKILFCGLFVQWSIIPLVHFKSHARSISKRILILREILKR